MIKQFNYRSVINFLPYLSGIIIAVSIFRAIAFYMVFGIRIVPFLDLSECLLMFLDHIIIIGVLFVLLFLIVLLAEKKENNNRDTTDELAIITQKKIKSKKLMIFFKRLSYFLLVIIWVIDFIYYPIYQAIILGISFSIYLLLLLYAQDIIKFIGEKITGESNTIGVVTRGIIAFSISYLVILVYFGLDQALRIRYGIAKWDVELTFKSKEVLHSSDSLFFIGSTRNYYFFFNPKTNEKTILSKDEISRVKIK